MKNMAIIKLVEIMANYKILIKKMPSMFACKYKTPMPLSDNSEIL